MLPRRCRRQRNYCDAATALDSMSEVQRCADEDGMSTHNVEGSPILAAFARQSQQVASGSEDNATPASPAPENQPQSPPQGANAQGDNVPRRKRRLQHVLKNTQRLKIVRWMIAEAEVNTLQGLCARTVRHFPNFFGAARMPILCEQSVTGGIASI